MVTAEYERLKALLAGVLSSRYSARYELAPEVYGPRIAAERNSDGRPVAITLLPTATVVRATQLDRLRAFSHIKTAELLEHGSCAAGQFVVQAETPARTLASIDRTAWELRHVVPVLSQTLAPLGQLHARGMCVGALLLNDITLARKQGRDLHVRIANFGLCAVAMPFARSEIAWNIAPELRASVATPSSASDIYSVGALFAALLSNERIPQHNLQSWWSTGRVPAWRKAPAALVDVVAAMVHPEPARRLQDGHAAMEALIDAVPSAMFRLPGSSSVSMPAIPLETHADATPHATVSRGVSAAPTPSQVHGSAAGPMHSHSNSSVEIALAPANNKRRWTPILAALGCVLLLGAALAFMLPQRSSNVRENAVAEAAVGLPSIRKTPLGDSFPAAPVPPRMAPTEAARNAENTNPQPSATSTAVVPEHAPAAAGPVGETAAATAEPNDDSDDADDEDAVEPPAPARKPARRPRVVRTKAPQKEPAPHAQAPKRAPPQPQQDVPAGLLERSALEPSERPAQSLSPVKPRMGPKKRSSELLPPSE